MRQTNAKNNSAPHKQRSNLHEAAGRILDGVLQRRGSVRSLVYASADAVDKRALLALVSRTLQERAALDAAVAAAGLRHSRRGELLAAALDAVKGKFGCVRGRLRAVISPELVRLKAAYALQVVRRNKEASLDPENRIGGNSAAPKLPRYARINPLAAPIDETMQALRQLGFVPVPIEAILDGLAPQKSFAADPHVPNLLAFAHKTTFHNSPLLEAGNIVLQDKASCFPAFILNPPQNSVVIDACAAPGNKTSHLSAIMNNSGSIFAFDKSANRLKTLIKLTGRAGCTNITPIHANFLETDPLDPKYKQVEYILLDPSCSGSGIVNRIDFDIDQEDADEDPADRINALAEFQKTAILHAFKFPSVRRVVYSTCSVHQQENEDVVAHVLKNNSEFRLASNVFPSWHRRGLDCFAESQKLIRSIPNQDAAIGFFVALFERKPNDQEQSAPQSESKAFKKKRKPKKKKNKKKELAVSNLMQNLQNPIQVDSKRSDEKFIENSD